VTVEEYMMMDIMKIVQDVQKRIEHLGLFKMTQSKQLTKVQFTSGCPNNCSYCYEPKEIKTYSNEKFFYDHNIHEEIQIMDMNFLSNPDYFKILQSLPVKKSYELVCGFDYRLFNDAIAYQFKENKFIKLRWAWDYGFSQQKKHRQVYKKLLKVGYKPKDLSVFILVNWKTPYIDCVRKLDLLKVWNVKVNDCCFDGGYKIAKPHYWRIDHIKNFRKMCRKHNQIVNFGIDPEEK